MLQIRTLKCSKIYIRSEQQTWCSQTWFAVGHPFTLTDKQAPRASAASVGHLSAQNSKPTSHLPCRAHSPDGLGPFAAKPCLSCLLGWQRMACASMLRGSARQCRGLLYTNSIDTFYHGQSLSGGSHLLSKWLREKGVTGGPLSACYSTSLSGRGGRAARSQIDSRAVARFCFCLGAIYHLGAVCRTGAPTVRWGVQGALVQSMLCSAAPHVME